jgi:hypothetical protein
MEELRDIKGFVEVPDESFFYLILSGVAVGLLLALLVWLVLWLRKPKRKSKRLSPKELAKLELKKIDFSDTKEAVYSFSENGQIVSPEHPALLDLLPKLEAYKFKKDVPELSSDDIEKMKSIIKELSS